MAGSARLPTNIFASIAIWLLAILVMMNDHNYASSAVCRCLRIHSPDVCDLLDDGTEILLTVEIISSTTTPVGASGTWLHTVSVIEDYNGSGFQLHSTIAYSTICWDNPVVGESYLVHLEYTAAGNELRIAEEPCPLYGLMSSVSASDLQALEDGACLGGST